MCSSSDNFKTHFLKFLLKREVHIDYNMQLSTRFFSMFSVKIHNLKAARADFGLAQMLGLCWLGLGKGG